MDKFFITFAGGDGRYIQDHHKTIKDAGQRLINQAIEIGLFNKTIFYTDKYLKNDTDFWNKHQQFIETTKKGYGFYLWKPYIIKKTMEQMKNNDILLYLDAGCEIDKNKPNEMGKLFERVKTEKICGQMTGFSEINWTKKDLFIELDMYNLKYAESQQRAATCILFLVCDETRKLVNEWYDLGCNYHLINDTGSKSTIPDLESKCGKLHQHRHDQSIFSLLTKKYNLFCSDIYHNPSIHTRRNRTGISRI